MPEILEPGDRALVMWMNAGGYPASFYVRIDGFARDADPLARWFNADENQAEAEDIAWTWVALCRRMAIVWTGPFPLNVGELLGGTDAQ